MNEKKGWDKFIQGEQIRSQLESSVSPWLQRAFGYHLLTLGKCSQTLDTKACAIKHKVHVDLEHADVIAQPHALPFAENSVDCVLAAHCLEFTENPHQLIREIHRVLVPQGMIILSGVNPLSFSGLRHKIGDADKEKLQLYFPSRIKDWLTLLGCSVESYQVMGTGYEIQRFGGLKALFSHIGGLYLIVARKQTVPLTRIRPKWQLQPQLNPAKVASLRDVVKQRS